MEEDLDEEEVEQLKKTLSEPLTYKQDEVCTVYSVCVVYVKFVVFFCQ